MVRFPWRRTEKVENPLFISVPADARYLRCIRGFLMPLFEGRFSEKCAGDLILAVDEACANSIKHGRSKVAGNRVQVLVLLDADRMEIRIEDFCGAKDVEKIRPRDLSEVRPGGLGTYFINAIMDEVRFVPDDGAPGRMALVMVKRGGKTRDEAQG